MGQAKQRSAEIAELKKAPKPPRMGKVELRAEVSQVVVDVWRSRFTRQAESPPTDGPVP